MDLNANVMPDRANRLAVGLVRSRGIHYDQALQILHTLCLRLVWTRADAGRAADQAAWLTAINTAHRAFLGGIEVQMPAGIPLRLPLKGVDTLNDAVRLIGYQSMPVPVPTHTVYLGEAPATAQSDDVCIHSDSWRAGVSDAGEKAGFQKGDADDIALGGIMAGAMAIHRCFVRAMHLPARFLDHASGLSLWNPRTDWHSPVATRNLRNLPNRFWMLGLGHVGQGFLWNLALLPYPRVDAVEFLLQDFDVIDESNCGSSLLCLPDSVGRKKTRQCAAWLERLGFNTTVTERRFSAADRRGEDEPAIAFCGFDRVTPRLHLDTANFGLVLECGLGGSLSDFDSADFHVFPSPRHTAQKLWSQFNDIAPKVDAALAKLFGNADDVCGAFAMDTAGKPVSTSFVGAMAGALAVAELLRTFNHGPRFDDITFDARSLDSATFLPAAPLRASELARMGCLRLA